jgi:cytochrome c-type biogenesis protein CcmH
MLLFWIIAALLCAALAGLVFWRAARTPRTQSAPPEQILYARQLGELDEQRAQGMLDEEGWRAARAEAGRRLLAVDAAPYELADPVRARRDQWLVSGLVVGAVVLGVLAYLVVGKPDLPDQPFAARMKGWEALASTHPERLTPAEAAALLDQRARAHPGDPEVWRYLGQAYEAAGQYLMAALAFDRAATLAPGDAPTWAALGEAQTLAAEGKVGPDARRAFEVALRLDPRSPAALWWLGRDDVLSGRKDQGLARFQTLAADLPADDPHQPELKAQIAQLKGAPAPVQPTSQAQAIASAEPADQAAMIRGMVARLAARLDHETGAPRDWAQLVRAYTVLGDTVARDRTLARARTLFAGRPADLHVIEAAAGRP